MTTIASDGVTVAADGLITAGHEPIAWNFKKLVERGGRLFGFSGPTCFQVPVVDWLIAGGDPASVPEVKLDSDDWTIAEFKPDAVYTYSPKRPYDTAYPYPFTLGSGQDHAITALDAGLSPEQAVRLAMRRNLLTGGEIMVCKVPGLTCDVSPPISIAAE